MKFYSWLVDKGLAVKTAKNYSSTVSGPLSLWANDNGLVDCPIEMIDDSDAFQRVNAGLRQLDIFIARDTKGKRMYSSALNKYEQFLSEQGYETLVPDLDQISISEGLSPTEKSELVTSRLGQGKFRKGLIAEWAGCSVTGYPGLALLVASHIKPWRAADNQERLDPANGLLLLPNIDKTFDLGFISFATDGKVQISPFLTKPELLGIHPTMSIRMKAHHKPFMEYHRDCVFRQP